MIAICVGHSRSGDNGAVSVGGVSEYAFNSRIAKVTAGLLCSQGIEATPIMEYQGSGYSAAMTWVAGEIKRMGAKAAIELHFNSATPSANGHEFLYWSNSSGGKALAKRFAQSYQETFPKSRPRQVGGTLGIRSASARGAQFLRKTHCPAMIAEPFFGSNQEEWDIASHNIDRIALAYAKAIAAWVKPS